MTTTAIPWESARSRCCLDLAFLVKKLAQVTMWIECPSAPPEAQWNVTYGSGLPAGDGYLADEVRLRPGGASFMSYGYNVWGGWAGKNPNTGLGVYKGDPIYGGATASLSRFPPT